MDKKSAIRKVRRYLSYLKDRNYKVRKAYLFGSFAKGGFHPESDIDLALVMRNVENDFLLQGDLLFMSGKIDSRIEPHPFDEKDFNDNNPLVDQILKTGIQII